MVCYTDGVVEAEGPQGRFGQDRVLAAIGRNGVPGRQVLDKILADLDEFTKSWPRKDDITLLVADLE